MRKITVGFTDFWPNFDPKGNFLINLLRKKYDVEVSDNPEFLFYSIFNMNHLKFKNCIKILWAGEAICPDFNECDYAIGFDRLDYGKRYLRNVTYVEKDLTPDVKYQDRKFCNFIYYNSWTGEGSKLRMDFCKALAKYKHVDCPGLALNNMEPLAGSRGDWKQKINFQSNYKFSIAFENTAYNGYVTEKIVHPFLANSVPIYWGDENICNDYNKKAFINCHDYKNFDEIIEHIIYLDNNDDEYLRMLHEPAMNPEFKPQDHELSTFLYNIIDHGKIYPKDPHNERGVAINRLLVNYFAPHEASRYSANDLCKILEKIVCDIPALSLSEKLLDPFKVDTVKDTLEETISPIVNEIPSDMLQDYTLNGAIPRQKWILDHRLNNFVDNSLETYDKVFDSLENGKFTYYGSTWEYIKKAIERFPIKDKSVIIYGLSGCNMDAVSLFLGAKEVVVVDYKTPVCAHDQVRVMDINEFRCSSYKADAAFSISTFHTDGLGRYGDPLNPEGDFRAMRIAREQLKPGGLLYLAVPVGMDCLVFNAHRIYGPIRLPLLLQDWNFLGSYGMSAKAYEYPLGKYDRQPLFILSNDFSALNIPSAANRQQHAQISYLASLKKVFDHNFYMRNYPDVLGWGGDLISHYILCGVTEKRNPTAWFNAPEYAQKHPEVAKKNIDPFCHFLLSGK